MNQKKEESYVKRNERKMASAPERKEKREKIEKDLWKYPIFKGAKS
jgi:hypothetical protein